MKDIKVIENFTYKFRLAVENLSESDYAESIWFNRFPNGCCGDASELLSKYLLNNGIEVEYVNGVCENQWHAWLEYAGYIIDITADQFPGICNKVLITTDKKWHSRFKQQTRRHLDFAIDNKPNLLRLSKLYESITTKIEKMESDYK